jgi:uncharacterized membrane protein
MKALAGPVFIAAGMLHFLRPGLYEQIMPPYLPAHRALVYASGAAEIVGGAALIDGRTRRFGMWWLTATLVAVFPANLHMALNPDDYRGVPGGRTALYARLPFQLLFIAWVRAAARTR